VRSPDYDVMFIFLCAFNYDNERDLHTEGVDTFNLDSIPTQAYHFTRASPGVTARAGPAARVVTVVDGRLRIPQEWVGKVEYVEVFDLRGRCVGAQGVGQAHHSRLPAELCRGTYFLERVR
jgi:hypothetical protein